MLEGSDSLAWYVVRTRSRHEKLVARQLTSRHLETFLPLVTRRNRWADRWKIVTLPLFPGYCFARFAHEARLNVRTAVGVVEILGADGRLSAVPDDEIEAIRRLVTSTLPVDPHPYLQAGMTVEVARGPLAGVRGVLVRKGRNARLVVAINLIRQAASVELDADDIEPVSRVALAGIRA
jgi:transcription antitermination factor NusG